jgi:hypothetical protein
MAQKRPIIYAFTSQTFEHHALPFTQLTADYSLQKHWPNEHTLNPSRHNSTNSAAAAASAVTGCEVGPVQHPAPQHLRHSKQLLPTTQAQDSV